MPENVRKFMKIGLNGVAMSPHGLIFDEDEATGCPMPLEPFPTSFRVEIELKWIESSSKGHLEASDRP